MAGFARRRTGHEAGYDAFISYSHQLDKELAIRLERNLERFAKPWYRMRALRVFRDDASLSANANLWASIQAAMAASKWMILLASPQAGRSPWVNREILWWLANKPNASDRLMIAVTDGTPSWGGGWRARDRSSSRIVPIALEQIQDEPRWVDLRDVRVYERGDDYQARMQNVIADLAAPLWNKSKDLLYGEAIRQHRITMRWVYSAVATLTVLTLVAVLGGVFAYVQRNQAIQERDKAIHDQLIAEALQFGSSDTPLAETGVEVSVARLLGERLHPATGSRIAYVACTVADATARVPSREVAEVRWASLREADELTGGIIHEPVRQCLSEVAGSACS